MSFLNQKFYFSDFFIGIFIGVGIVSLSFNDLCEIKFVCNILLFNYVFNLQQVC